MKVSVCACVTYHYEVEVPDDVDIESAADSGDPVYNRICKVMANEHLNFEGEIISIVDNDSDEVYYSI